MHESTTRTLLSQSIRWRFSLYNIVVCVQNKISRYENKYFRKHFPTNNSNHQGEFVAEEESVLNKVFTNLESFFHRILNNFSTDEWRKEYFSSILQIV